METARQAFHLFGRGMGPASGELLEIGDGDEAAAHRSLVVETVESAIAHLLLEDFASWLRLSAQRLERLSRALGELDGALNLVELLVSGGEILWGLADENFG